MINSLKKVMLAGVGAALITREKAEETLNDFVQQGRINAADAKALARQLAKDGKKEFASVRSDVEDKLLNLAQQAGSQAQARIAAGDWASGKELPSIRALAASLNVSVITIKRAYLDLESEGVIVTRHGKGSFVADVNGLAGELQEQKLEGHLADAVAIARQMGLTDDELATRLRRALKEQK